MIVQELREIQERCGWLPPAEMRALSTRLNEPLHRLHEVASFYPLYRLEPPPTVAVAKQARKKPDEMIEIVEDLIKLLDDVSTTYRRGKHPDPRDAKKIAAVLRALADDIEL